MQEIKGAQRNTSSTIDLDELAHQIERLSTQRRLLLARKLQEPSAGLRDILRQHRCFCALELGGSAREIGQQLEKLPPEVFEKLVEAIGMAIRSRSKSF